MNAATILIIAGIACALFVANASLWFFFTREMRRTFARECLQFRALGWNEHREQVERARAVHVKKKLRNLKGGRDAV